MISILCRIPTANILSKRRNTKKIYDEKTAFIIVNFGFYALVFPDYLHGKHR